MKNKKGIRNVRSRKLLSSDRVITSVIAEITNNSVETLPGLETMFSTFLTEDFKKSTMSLTVRSALLAFPELMHADLLYSIQKRAFLPFHVLCGRDLDSLFVGQHSIMPICVWRYRPPTGSSHSCPKMASIMPKKNAYVPRALVGSALSHYLWHRFPASPTAKVLYY